MGRYRKGTWRSCVSCGSDDVSHIHAFWNGVETAQPKSDIQKYGPLFIPTSREELDVKTVVIYEGPHVLFGRYYLCETCHTSALNRGLELVFDKFNHLTKPLGWRTVGEPGEHSCLTICHDLRIGKIKPALECVEC